MPTTAADLVAEANSRIESIDPEHTARALADGAVVVDLREADELEETGAIPGAVHVPRGLLEFRADPSHALHAPELDPHRRTIVYCASGGRSALAVLALHALGYDNVAHLAGGLVAWRGAGRATTFADSARTTA
jgi:rhodanese-related sulfurtransferase